MQDEPLTAYAQDPPRATPEGHLEAPRRVADLFFRARILNKSDVRPALY
jgi:hypothetical protein